MHRSRTLDPTSLGGGAMGIPDRLRIAGTSERQSWLTWGIGALLALGVLVALWGSLVDGSGPYG